MRSGSGVVPSGIYLGGYGPKGLNFPQVNDLLLWKPKTVGKYNQIQYKIPLKC